MKQSKRKAAETPCVTTEHSVHTGVVEAGRIAVDHRSYEAVQYDFYLPAAILKAKVVREFLTILAAVDGATVSPNQIGIWKGQSERTQVFRVIIRLDDPDAATLRRTLRGHIGQLMATLSISRRYAQKALMVTETSVRVTLAENARPVE